jgi:hypothetical protein
VVLVGDIELTVRPPHCRYRVCLQKVLSFVLLETQQLVPLVVYLDQADRDLGRPQAMDLDFA